MNEEGLGQDPAPRREFSVSAIRPRPTPVEGDSVPDTHPVTPMGNPVQSVRQMRWWSDPRIFLMPSVPETVCHSCVSRREFLLTVCASKGIGKSRRSASFSPVRDTCPFNSSTYFPQGGSSTFCDPCPGRGPLLHLHPPAVVRT